jgi:hypothetical protein
MRYLFGFIVTFLSFSLNAQLEKIGVFSNTSFVVQKYRSFNNANINSTAFIGLRHRVGAMASFYLDSRFSYEVGIVADHHQKPESERRRFKYDDGLIFNLNEHKFVNLGIPLIITMRTNNARNCTTYFKLSLINLFTVYDNQRVANTELPDRLAQLPLSMSSTNSDIKYFSTDIDFGFGTFWHLKKLGAKLCLEPRITVAQYRGGVQANHLPEREIFNPEFSILTSMGFEVTIYKDML